MTSIQRKRLETFAAQLQQDVDEHQTTPGNCGGPLLGFVSHATRRDLLEVLKKALRQPFTVLK